MLDSSRTFSIKTCITRTPSIKRTLELSPRVSCLFSVDCFCGHFRDRVTCSLDFYQGRGRPGSCAQAKIEIKEYLSVRPTSQTSFHHMLGVSWKTRSRGYTYIHTYIHSLFDNAGYRIHKTEVLMWTCLDLLVKN